MVAKYRAVLSIPGCPRLLTSALLGRLPQGMSSLAVLLLVRAATHSYAAAGIAVGASAFATAAGSPLQGRLVDGHGRVRVLLPVAVGQFAALVALVVAAHARAPGAALIALAGVAGGSQPAIAPSVRALLRDVAPDTEVRETAYALDSVSQELIWITGPLIVAVVVALSSPSGALLAAGGVCLIGTALFVSSPLARRRRRAAAAGGGRALAIPELRMLLGPLALMGMSIGTVEVGIPSLALHAGSRPSAGLLLALWSVGSLSGGLWYGSRSFRRPLAERFGLLMLAAAVCTAPLIAARTIPEGLLCSLVAGLAIAPAFSCLYALVGRAVTAGAETEAFTWAASALIVGLAAGSALGGLAIGAAGVSGPFVLGCAASLAAAGLALRAGGRRVSFV
jgi:MFS family permease